jgi:carboxylesterase type B
MLVTRMTHGDGSDSCDVEDRNDDETAYHMLYRAAAGGDVIVVAVSYRLTVIGFIALDGLSSEDPRGSSGNYGITDQQQALQWVQKNAAAFGGDASRVTVYGQSSGGTSIFSLLSSPASKGLFSAAISLSGIAVCAQPFHESTDCMYRRACRCIVHCCAILGAEFHCFSLYPLSCVRMSV